MTTHGRFLRHVEISPTQRVGARGAGIFIADVEFVVGRDCPAALHHGARAVVVADEELLIPGLGDRPAAHVQRARAALAADNKITAGVEHRAAAEVKGAVASAPLSHIEIVVQGDGSATLGEGSGAIVAADKSLVAAGFGHRAARHGQYADTPVVTDKNLVVHRHGAVFEAEGARAVERVTNEEFPGYGEGSRGVHAHSSCPVVTKGPHEQIACGIERTRSLGEAREAGAARGCVRQIVGAG